MKRTPLRSIGKRRRAKQAARAETCDLVRDRDVVCQFGIRPIAFKVYDECRAPLDVHEIIPRSVWPDGDLDPSNCILLCRWHHTWVTDNPFDAAAIGLHQFSWQRGTR